MTFSPPHDPLRKPREYPQSYAPALLFPIARAQNRSALGIRESLPFDGVDIWNAYELSWLNERGKPVAAMGELIFPASSPNIVESKSLKLYLNSLNQDRFASAEHARLTIQRDLSAAAGADVRVHLEPVSALSATALATLPGTCLDDLAVEIADYDVNPGLLDGATAAETGYETLHTHLFKSNCPVTGQPDWASVLVRYRGPAIDHAALLKYLVSYRNRTAFHEHCVEAVFLDIAQHCRPEALTVYARYTRRGGLDINPFRSDFEAPPKNERLTRQ